MRRFIKTGARFDTVLWARKVSANTEQSTATCRHSTLLLPSATVHILDERFIDIQGSLREDW
jgi:hypothetical protein